MRKIHTLLLIALCFVCSTHLLAQTPLKQINIISFNVKSKLTADVSSWGSIPAGLMLVAQKVPQINVQGIKLVMQIKQAGARICGTSVDASQQIDINNVRNFTGNELVGYLSQCPTLRPGNYIICVQFFNIDRYPISEERCRDFVVEDQVQVQQSYSAPQNITPVNQKKFSVSEQNAPITFRWTPLVPKPQTPVTYRLKVWQLMQGQSGSQAMRSNATVVEKDVTNITQAVIANLYTGPCRPPYLCDYVWNVQALDKEGKPLGNNNGTSELSSWSWGATQIGTLKLLSPENKSVIKTEENAPINFRWTPLVPKPQGPVTYRLKVWQLMQGQSGSQAMRTNPPIVTKDVDNITQAIVTNIYTGPCRPPYLCDYVWSVQAIDKDEKPISVEEVSSWSFGATQTSTLKLLSPENKSVIAAVENAPVNFRWTPLVPKPQSSVTYRLKVWQLMQGQNSTQAMRTNQPIVTKDVADITEASVSNIYTGPCRPPYLCDYVWCVQALDKNNLEISTTELASFKYSSTTSTATSTCCIGTNWTSQLWGTTPSPATPLPISPGIFPNINCASTLYFDVSHTCAAGCVGPAQIDYNFYTTSGTLLSTNTALTGGPISIIAPTAAGSYLFYIVARCGTDTCDTLKYQTTIVCNCCAGSSWSTKLWGNAAPATTSLPPSFSFLGNVLIGTSLNFNVVFNCAPSCGPAQIKYQFVDPTTGSIVGIPVSSSSGLASIVVPSVTPGTYLFKIYAYCTGAGLNTPCDSLIYKCNIINCCTGSSWGVKKFHRWGTPPMLWAPLSCNNLYIGTLRRNKIHNFKVCYNCPPGCISSMTYEIFNGLGTVVSATTIASCPGPANILIPLSVPLGSYTIKFTAYCGGTVCNVCMNRFTLVP